MFEKVNNKSISLIIGVSIFCLLIVLSVFAWTGPSGTPPDPNAPAPINVSSSGQEKEGQVGIAIPSGESLDGSYGLTVGTASNPLGIKTTGDVWIDGNFYVDTNTGGNAAYITRLGATTQGLKTYATDRDLYTRYIEDSAEASPGTWHFINEKDGGSSYEFMTAQTDGDVIFNTGNVGVGTTAPLDKLHVAGNVRVDGAIVAPEGTLRDNGGGWVRTYGNTGWYNQSYGGGWYMSDTTWLRTYSNKSIYSGTGIIRSDASVRAPIFYDQNNTAYYVNPGGTSNIYAIEASGPIDANQNYIYGQRCCWNVVVDAIGGFSNTPKGYCWDALGAYYSPVAVSCQNVQEVTALPNRCNTSGDDHCYYFSNEAGVANVCDYSTGGDAVISCCKTRGTCGETP